MLFSLFTALIRSVSFLPERLVVFLCGILEITTGSALIAEAPLIHSTKIILTLAATTFGGLSAVAQTYSVLRNTGLSIIHYIGIKGLSSLFALLLGGLWMFLSL